MSEGGAKHHLRNVDTFAAGEYRGLTYSRADIGDMARNFRDFSSGPTPYHRVPAVLGHSENQDILDQEGLPAAAWATGMRQQGDHARTDLGDMPHKVANAIRNKSYRTTSAEVWDRPPASIPRSKVLAILRQRGIDPQKALADAVKRAPATLRQQQADVARGTRPRTDSLSAITDYHLRGHLGKMLRRLAFLGADVPELKNLDDLPGPEEYAEQFAPAYPSVLKFREIKRARSAEGIFHVFSEVVDMEPDQMKQALVGHGLSEEAVAKMPPDVMAEVARVCESKDAAADQDKFDDDAGPQEGAGQDEQQQYRERAMKYGEGLKKYAGRFRKYAAFCDDDEMKKYAEGLPEEGDDPPVKKKTGEDEPPMKYSEVAKLVKRAVADALKGSAAEGLSELQKFAEETRAAEKKRAVDAVLDRLGREGRLPPVQRESVRGRLMRADSKSTVEKFSDGPQKGKPATEFDLQVRELEKAPSLFREGARGTTPPGSDNADDEVATVEKFSESADFAGALKAAGKTSAQYVEAFKEARKKKPELTARQYGVPA